MIGVQSLISSCMSAASCCSDELADSTPSVSNFCLIAGSASLFDTFAQAYRSYYLTENPKGYIDARLDDQAARRAKGRYLSCCCDDTVPLPGWFDAAREFA